MPEPILDVRDVTVDFPVRGSGKRRTYHRAVDAVSFSVTAGERLGIVGESGSGKSTLCKALAGICPPTSGEVRFRGEPLPARRPPPVRRAIQIVFQDPYSSLNPRRRVGAVLAEAVAASRSESGAAPSEKVRELLSTVGLPASAADVRPAKLSGGQRQRVAIARALAVDPAIVLADEVTSALDVSVQAVIVELLGRLTIERGLTLVFVTHNLQVVRALCTRVGVMHGGRIVEMSSASALFRDAKHPYTRALLAAVPRLRPGDGESAAASLPPRRDGPPTRGCAYRVQCPLARAKCAEVVPRLLAADESDDSHEVACHAVADRWQPGVVEDVTRDGQLSTRASGKRP